VASRLLETAAEKEQENKAKAAIWCHKIHDCSSKQCTNQQQQQRDKNKATAAAEND
jgi:hypothetical protein